MGSGEDEGGGVRRDAGGMMRCGARSMCGVVCGVAWGGVVWRGVVWCGVVWRATRRGVACYAAWGGTAWCGAACRVGGAQCSGVRWGILRGSYEGQ